MNITGQKTALKKSVLTNPTNEIYDSLIRPTATIGFTFDKQPERSIMVFAVHVSYKIEYSITCNYLFEGYDGTVFNSYIEKPIPHLLLIVVKSALKRLNELLNKEIKNKRIYLAENPSINFLDSEILKILTLDINDAYKV